MKTAVHRHSILERSDRFCERFGLSVPVLLAPMAGACPPRLSVAVANAGGMGAGGVVLMSPSQITAWVSELRSQSAGPFQLNCWIPGPAPRRDLSHEARVRMFLGAWGPSVLPEAGDFQVPDFNAQCEAMLQARPTAISSIMGVYPREFVARMKQEKIAWFATATTVTEAKLAEDAGADVIIAQGSEAGGHRGSFNPEDAEANLVGLFALLPALARAVDLPVVAAGGIADGQTAAAALMLGASAVQVGTGLLRCPEAEIHPAWAEAIAHALPEQTTVTRAFSGRAGRSIATDYVRAASAADAPAPAPYPVQRGLTSAMRAHAQQTNDVHRMQVWAGQSARMAEAKPAAEVLRALWASARTLLS